MKNLNSCIRILGKETISQSRILLVNSCKLVNNLCLTIELNDNIVIQDELIEIDKATGFNAFDEISKEESHNTLLLLLQKLSDDNIEKINNLLK